MLSPAKVTDILIIPVRNCDTPSRNRGGCPRIDAEIQSLIRRIARANPAWGAPRIHGELGKKLGFEISEAAVSRYMPVGPKPPSQTWRSFLRNHPLDLMSIDFFVMPTAPFRILYVFVVIERGRRRILHFNVTDAPSAQWTGQQLVDAFESSTSEPPPLPRRRVHRSPHLAGNEVLRSQRSNRLL